MSENDLRQAILLIKTGNKEEAQRLLKSLVEADLTDIHAWVWYVETLPTLSQKIRALELCLKYNPGNERVEKGLNVLKGLQAQAGISIGPTYEKPSETQFICPYCGASLREGTSVCFQCGKSLRPHFTLSGLDIRFRLPSLNTLRRWGTSLNAFFAEILKMKTWGLLIFILPALGLCLIGIWLVRKPPVSDNNNVLAIGESAKVETLDLSITPSMEFDYLTKAEILELRKKQIYLYPELIYSGYTPSEGVFGRIIDGLPWWGIAGQFYYGLGEKSIEGPSEESRFILNPYLLVAAEPCGGYDKNKVSETTIQHPGFAFYCPPSLLKWEPKISYAEVTYDADCVSQRNYSCFNLIAYNAWDLNLNYIYVAYEDSANISKENRPNEAYAIRQYIHKDDSCDFPGGCNNMSHEPPVINGLSVTGFPARAEIWFWKEAPTSLDISPDMTFVIRIR